MSQLQVTVDGTWLDLVCLYGDVEMSTVWPGGSDQLAWTMSGIGAHRFPGGVPVRGWYGPQCVWYGQLDEPDPSQDKMTATGAWRAGDGYAALDGSGNATLVPNTAIDQAIVRDLPWTRVASVSSTAVDDDISQGPLQVGALLSSWSEQSGQRWGVSPAGVVFAKADDTAPAYQTLAMANGLGYARDTYASTLVGRYQTSTGYATAIRTNTTAEAAHGHVEAPVDLTPRGVLTATKANTILDNMLALGRAVPQWTQGLDLTYGEILNAGGTPVALETVRAEGNLLRVHTGWDLGWRHGGHLYVDVLIGRTQLSFGVLAITPADQAIGTLADFIAKAVAAGATKPNRRT